MAIQINCSQPDHARIRFMLSATDHPGGVSVVGTFNDWVPGIDELLPQPDGTRAVTIGVPYGVPIVFRYLGEQGLWFDDPQADKLVEIVERAPAS
jgi:hypothetical protein